MAAPARHSWSVGEILKAADHNTNDSRTDYIPFELDYAQITAAVTGITATTEGTAVAVITGNSVTYSGDRVKIEFWAPSFYGGAGYEGHFVVLRDTTVVGQFTRAAEATASSQSASVYGVAFDTPAAGAHTYAVKAFTGTSQTVNVAAGSGGSGNQLPAFLRVTNAKQ